MIVISYSILGLDIRSFFANPRQSETIVGMAQDFVGSNNINLPRAWHNFSFLFFLNDIFDDNM